MTAPTERFSSRVDAYVAARPRYRREVIDHLTNAVGLTPNWTIADIGSGTGISTQLFLENGNMVYAVEPNGPMRAAAEKWLGPSRNFHSVTGTAESTTLEDKSIDLIVAAQAFHWFKQEAARTEFTRILKPNGYVLLMWNSRKLTGTPFLDAYEDLLLTYGTDYTKIRHSNITNEELSGFFNGGRLKSASLPNHQHLDFEGLRARLLSSSYIPQNNPRMLDQLRKLFDDHNHKGQVTIEYQTELFLGQLT